MSCIKVNVRANERIRARKILVIDPDGNKVGVMSRQEALNLAQEDYDLDLVEVAPNASPPVCRIMDFGKWKYEQEQKMKKAKKHQSQIIVKEMKLRPKIGDHDFEVKRRRVEKFLKDGNKVKVSLRFRGREIVHKDIARNLLERLVDEVSDYGEVESKPKMDGRVMVMMLGPKKEKDKNS